MAYCGPRGIPLSVFLGRAVGPGEPQWLASDRRAALDFQAYEARRCRNCGTHPDDIADGTFHAHLEQCKGCQARERMTESLAAEEQQRGVHAVTLPYAAPSCPRCSQDLAADD
jgi:hypothetical protein